jgi:hypothetical protein
MNKLVIGAVVAVAVAGGGYLLVDRLADSKANETVSTYLKDHDLDKTVKYRNVDYALTSGALTIEGLTAENASPGYNLAVERVVLDSKQLQSLGGTRRAQGNELLVLTTVRRFEGLTLRSGRGGDNIVIDRFDVERYETADTLPTAVEVTMTGLHLPSSNVEQLGIGEATINAHLAYGVDAGRRTLTVRDYTFQAPGLGSLTLSLQMGNLNIDRLRQISQPGSSEDLALVRAFAGDLGTMELTTASLTLKDEGLVDRVLEQQARRQGTNKEELRRLSLAQLDQAISDQRSSGLRQIFQGMRALIATSNGKLSLTVNPPARLPVGEIGMLATFSSANPQPLIDRLGLQVAN